MHPYIDDALLALLVTAMLGLVLGLVIVNLAKDPAIGNVGVAVWLAASVELIFVGFARLVLWLAGE